nr:MAG TPA: FeoB-associated Cys-rich membrane protein [Caudoviricetes sp.]
MIIESVVGKIIIIALVVIGLYAFFALVDLIRTKGSK